MFLFPSRTLPVAVPLLCRINEEGNNTIILVDALKGNKGGEWHKLLDSIMSASNKKT